VDRMTPWYLIREELQREKLRCRAVRRAWGYERRLEEERGSELGRECRGEMKKRIKEGKASTEWEKGRIRFWENKGIGIEEIEVRGMEEVGIIEELIYKDKAEQRIERWERIREGKFCKWYKEIKGDGIPEYLKIGWGEGRWSRIARWRMGNEIREGRYWEEPEKRTCRLCGGEVESWEHVWEGCRRWEEWEESWQEAVKWVLGEKGEGEEWMRRMERERREMGDGRDGREEGGGEEIGWYPGVG